MKVIADFPGPSDPLPHFWFTREAGVGPLVIEGEAEKGPLDRPTLCKSPCLVCDLFDPLLRPAFRSLQLGRTSLSYGIGVRS